MMRHWCQGRWCGRLVGVGVAWCWCSWVVACLLRREKLSTLSLVVAADSGMQGYVQWQAQLGSIIHVKKEEPHTVWHTASPAAPRPA